MGEDSSPLPAVSEAKPLLRLAQRWRRRVTDRQYVFAYGAQLVGFLTALVFNLVLPLQVGARIYGASVAAFSLPFSVFALFVPGYSLAAVRHLAPMADSASHIRLLLRWLMVPAFAAATGVLLFGGLFGPNLSSWSGAVSVYAAALVPLLSATHFLDCVLVARNRNGLSILGRLVLGVGIGIIPWALARLHPSPASVLLGVLLAYLIAMSAYAQALRPHAAASSAVGASQAPRLRALVSSSVHYSAISLTSILFAWASLLIVSWSVTPEELGGLKIALAVPTAAVALMPFPQVFIFARLQAAAASKSSGHAPTGRWILGIAACVGLLAAVIIHLVGPIAISMVYGPTFGAAAAYTGVLAWMVVPQLVEQPLVAVLSTVHAPSNLTAFYIIGLVTSLAVPVLARLVFGEQAYAPGLVVGRIISVAVPAAMLLKRTRPPSLPEP